MTIHIIEECPRGHDVKAGEECAECAKTVTWEGIELKPRPVVRVREFEREEPEVGCAPEALVARATGIDPKDFTHALPFRAVCDAMADAHRKIDAAPQPVGHANQVDPGDWPPVSRTVIPPAPPAPPSPPVNEWCLLRWGPTPSSLQFGLGAQPKNLSFGERGWQLEPLPAVVELAGPSEGKLPSERALEIFASRGVPPINAQELLSEDATIWRVLDEFIGRKPL